jgi:hypothetical protein
VGGSNVVIAERVASANVATASSNAPSSLSTQEPESSRAFYVVPKQEYCGQDFVLYNGVKFTLIATAVFQVCEQDQKGKYHNLLWIPAPNEVQSQDDLNKKVAFKIVNDKKNDGAAELHLWIDPPSFLVDKEAMVSYFSKRLAEHIPETNAVDWGVLSTAIALEHSRRQEEANQCNQGKQDGMQKIKLDLNYADTFDCWPRACLVNGSWFIFCSITSGHLYAQHIINNLREQAKKEAKKVVVEIRDDDDKENE